jgi:hypothetical protein
MWNLLALLLVIAFLALWLHHAREPEGMNQDLNPENHGPSTSVSKAEAAELAAPAGPVRSITYELTRWDLFQNQATIVFRNRVVQVVILLGIVGVEAVVLRGYYGAPPAFLLSACFAAVCNLLGWLAVTLLLVSLAMSFLFKQRGVVGQHTLEITDRGLSERTDYNENLAKWASIRRLHSTRRYLYIYVSDFNFYAVPKRCFAGERIAGFEAELRAFIKRGQPVPPAA